MARLAISLLAVLLVASYASATNLEEVCKGTVDAQYCQELLQTIVTVNTDFTSVTWKKLVIDRATVASLNASSSIVDIPRVPASDKDRFKSCLANFESSTKLLRESATQFGTNTYVPEKVDQATSQLKACNDSLEKPSPELTPLRDAANRAYKACVITKKMIAE